MQNSGPRELWLPVVKNSRLLAQRTVALYSVRPGLTSHRAVSTFRGTRGLKGGWLYEVLSGLEWPSNVRGHP